MHTREVGTLGGRANIHELSLHYADGQSINRPCVRHQGSFLVRAAQCLKTTVPHLLSPARHVAILNPTGTNDRVVPCPNARAPHPDDTARTRNPLRICLSSSSVCIA